MEKISGALLILSVLLFGTVLFICKLIKNKRKLISADFFDSLKLGEDDLINDSFEFKSCASNIQMNVSPYTINITNESPETKKAVVFGMNHYLLCENFGSDTGINITPSVSTVSYLQLLQQSAVQTFDISLTRICSDKKENATPILTLISSDANGQSCTIPIITKNYLSPNQFQENIVDVNFNFKIDGNTYLEILCPANSKVTFSFFPKPKVGKKILVSQLIKPIVKLSKLKLINNYISSKWNKIKSVFKTKK